MIPKDYAEEPQTLGEHLKRRRKLLGLLQREAATQLGCDQFTYINWEKDKTVPAHSRFRPIIEFLRYDPSPPPATLAEQVQAKRRAMGMTFAQVARHLGFDDGTLSRYLRGCGGCLPTVRGSSKPSSPAEKPRINWGPAGDSIAPVSRTSSVCESPADPFRHQGEAPLSTPAGDMP